MPLTFKDMPDILPNLNVAKLFLVVARNLQIGRIDLISDKEAQALLDAHLPAPPAGTFCLWRGERCRVVGFAFDELSQCDEPWVEKFDGKPFPVLLFDLEKLEAHHGNNH